MFRVEFSRRLVSSAGAIFKGDYAHGFPVVLIALLIDWHLNGAFQCFPGETSKNINPKHVRKPTKQRDNPMEF